MTEPDDEQPQAWLELAPVDRYGDPYRVIPICDIPSPTNVMLCILPESGDLQHHFEQHLGIDKHGNFRGWADKRSRT